MRYLLYTAIFALVSAYVSAQTTGSLPPIVFEPQKNPQQPIDLKDYSPEKLIPLIGQEIKNADMICMVPQTPLIYDDFLNNYRVLSAVPLDTVAKCPSVQYETYYFNCLLRNPLRTYLNIFIHLDKKSIEALKKLYPKLSQREAKKIVSFYRKILKHTEK